MGLEPPMVQVNLVHKNDAITFLVIMHSYIMYGFKSWVQVLALSAFHFSPHNLFTSFFSAETNFYAFYRKRETTQHVLVENFSVNP